ncbi:2Fe-2S iron-sulfur cluster binding domain-containing protein [Clostridia bacterium]|nr:2Fe-2S iron-sulfur cluster binding domain-containing protein [Clostridia bacterium]
MQISMIINGQEKAFNVEPDEYLSDTLRSAGYKSIKRGCDKSSCGACTVLLEGKPILSCSYLSFRANGKKVTTLEGEREEAIKLGSLIIKEGGDQCGFCTPSLILTTIALKRENANPTEEDIKHYTNGNLCRCTGYVAQLNGIKKYLGVE